MGWGVGCTYPIPFTKNLTKNLGEKRVGGGEALHIKHLSYEDEDYKPSIHTYNIYDIKFIFSTTHTYLTSELHKTRKPAISNRESEFAFFFPSF